MRNNTSQDVVKIYREVCLILKETELTGDYKRGNKEGKKVVNAFKLLESDLKLATETLYCLLSDDNVVTRAKAAAHCISLNVFVDEAETVLQNIAEIEKHNIFGFNAEMTLKVWKRQGYLKVYPTQEIKTQRTGE